MPSLTERKRLICMTNLKLDRSTSGWWYAPNWNPVAGPSLAEIDFERARMLIVDHEHMDDQLHGRNGKAAFSKACVDAHACMEQARKATGGKLRTVFFDKPGLLPPDNPVTVGRDCMRWLLLPADGVSFNVYDDMQPEAAQLIRADRNRRCMNSASVFNKPIVACVSETYQRVGEAQTKLIPIERLRVQVRAALTVTAGLDPNRRYLWCWSPCLHRVKNAALTRPEPGTERGEAILEARKFLNFVYDCFPSKWTEFEIMRILRPKIVASLQAMRAMALEELYPG